MTGYFRYNTTTVLGSDLALQIICEFLQSFHCKDGEKKDDSLPGMVSVHKLSGLDNSEHLLRKLF